MRRYTILSVLIVAALINLFFFIIEKILENNPSLSFGSQKILFMVTIFVTLIVVWIFLYYLDSIRDQMVSNLKKLISLIRMQSGSWTPSPIVIENLTCDDEICEIIELLNDRSDSINDYVDHLKHVVGYIQHEINTPLATLVLLIDEYKESYPQVDFRSLEEEISILSATANGLATLTKDDVETKRQPVDLVSLAKSIISLYEGKTMHRFVLEGADSYSYPTDKYFMYTIMRNIIHNASKYSWENTVITVTIENKKIMIKDNGVWISEEDHKKIRLPFWKKSSARSEESGIGLGLSLVKKLAEILEIKILLDSHEWKGTVFTLMLP